MGKLWQTPRNMDFLTILGSHKKDFIVNITRKNLLYRHKFLSLAISESLLVLNTRRIIHSFIYKYHTQMIISRTCFSTVTHPSPFPTKWPGRVAQSVARLTPEPEVPGSLPGPATYFLFSFRWFKKGSGRYWKMYVPEVLVDRLGGLSLPKKSVFRLTDRPAMTIAFTLDVK